MNKMLTTELEKISPLKLSIALAVYIQCRKIFSIDNSDKNIQYRQFMFSLYPHSSRKIVKQSVTFFDRHCTKNEIFH